MRTRLAAAAAEILSSDWRAGTSVGVEGLGMRVSAAAWGREADGLGVSRQREERAPESRPASATGEVDVAELVAGYAGVVFRVAHAVLHSRAEAEDVVQETFLRTVRYRKPLAEIRDMRVWLVRIAWRLALDRRRRVRPEQMDRIFAESLVAMETPADVALAQAEQYLRVMGAMERLPRAEREVLLLSAVEEMATAEMAAVLGRSESAVRALLFRARTRLKERWG